MIVFISFILVILLVIPARLSPSYSYDYKDGKDNLFEQELKKVMKNLGEDALAALPIPSLSLYISYYSCLW